MEELWPHHLRKVVVPEGEAGEDAQILKDVSDHQAESSESEDTAEAV